jgi:hypothetical protein
MSVDSILIYITVKKSNVMWNILPKAFLQMTMDEVASYNQFVT